MSYKQWISISIMPINFNIKVKNVTLLQGKFHVEENRNAELQPSEIESKTINAKEHYEIFSCGRDCSPSGTEGSISLFDGNKLIAQSFWNNPWWPSASESLLLCNIKSDYFFRAQLYGTGEYERPLGSVIIDALKYPVNDA